MVDGSSENCLHKKLLDSSKFSDEGAEFFSLLAAHSIGQHRQLLVEAFEAMDAAEYHSIWTNTSDTILNIISLVLENLQRSDVSVVENINAVKIAFSTILTSLSARGFNKADTSSFTIINKLLVASQELLCLTTDNEDVSLAAMKLAIARVVEQWWLQGMPQVESLVPQFLTYLMITALNVKGTVSDVKRILSVKEAFNLLELRNESSSFIRDLMLRSFLHPCFLKAPEGQRLLSFFLAIDKGLLIHEVAKTVRVHMVTSSKYLPTAIGAVLVRAWAEVSSANGADSDPNGSAEKSTGGTPAAVLIEDNVQQLLQEAVHLREQKTFSCFRSLLRAFHDVRRSVEIDAMLFRIYDPIIWRSLRCANASVRANASVLFLDIFPLQSSGGNAEQDERILQKQFDLLSTLLTDSDQRVRALTALGVCHILTEYWDVLPTATTHNLLKYLVDTLAVDASCATVRLAVFQGLEVLLQQPLAHEVVKNLLPLLRNTIHDKSEKVRVAFIRILCQIKELRGVHFYDIVPLDDMLSRLVEDARRPAVCVALTDLLLNSFFPSKEDVCGAGAGAGAQDAVAGLAESRIESIDALLGSDQKLLRCLRFVEANPLAAEVFYAHLHRFVAFGSTANLCQKIFCIAVSSLPNAAADNQKGTGKRSRNHKSQHELDNGRLLLPVHVRICLMRIAAMVLENLTPELPSQQPSLQLLLAYINEETVARAMAACQPDDPCRWHLLLPVLRIATCVIRMHSYAQQGVDAEEGSWLPRLLDLFVEACECDSVLRRQVFSTLSALVLALDQQDELVEMLLTALQDVHSEDRVLPLHVALMMLESIVVENPDGYKSATVDPLIGALQHLLHVFIVQDGVGPSISGEDASRIQRVVLSLQKSEGGAGAADAMATSLSQLRGVITASARSDDDASSERIFTIVSSAVLMLSDAFYLGDANDSLRYALSQLMQDIEVLVQAAAPQRDQANAAAASMLTSVARLSKILAAHGEGLEHEQLLVQSLRVLYALLETPAAYADESIKSKVESASKKVVAQCCRRESSLRCCVDALLRHEPDAACVNMFCELLAALDDTTLRQSVHRLLDHSEVIDQRDSGTAEKILAAMPQAEQRSCDVRGADSSHQQQLQQQQQQQRARVDSPERADAQHKTCTAAPASARNENAAHNRITASRRVAADPLLNL